MATGRMPDRIRLEGLFRQIVEAAPNAMVMIKTGGQIEMVNAQVERVFGYQRNEMLGRSIEMLMPERFRGHHAGLRAAFFASPRPGPMGPGRDLYARRKDGSEFQVEIGLNPIDTDDGPMVLSAIVDISHRKEEKERIQAALREKDILLGEIHHRVKNNLQIIYSLLNLQSARITDPVALDMLRDSQNRVRSMALIHQTLYGSRDFARVDFALFIDTLLPVLADSYGINPGRVSVRVDVEPVRLPINTAVPCGLVVNELIANAFKHAFPGQRSGEIRVALTRQAGDEALLSVSDNGIGLPEHIDAEGSGSLGLQLVNLLANQLSGAITISRSDPTRFSLRFPI
jgi:two-component system, sensor histidine kinase PdtaS